MRKTALHFHWLLANARAWTEKDKRILKQAEFPVRDTDHRVDREASAGEPTSRDSRVTRFFPPLLPAPIVRFA